MKVITTFFLILLILLQYRLWFGNGSLNEVHQLQDKISKIEQEKESLKERNFSLAAEVHDLKHGYEAIEERARSEMGMIKDGEIFYQIVNHSDFQIDTN
ncbi:MAG: cell division protein FtsB [Legionellales bacterium]|nr:cell division protein FtsB [Legionellales bacterium]|tara:strand:- start:1192 stop:1488 length:297 start_codon:yes stop_codon:yes gene_type:complete